MKIVIFGTTEYSSYVYKTMLFEGYNNIVAFTLSQDRIEEATFCELPLIPFEELHKRVEEPFKILLTIGYSKMNKGREYIYNLCKKKEYKIYTYISSRAICDTNDLGEGCLIMPLAYIPADAQIGICNIINPGAYLSHTGTVGNFNWICPNVSMGGNVVIGDNCFIGLGSVIKNGISVGSSVFLGANSYLVENAESDLAYIGNPAENKSGYKSKVLIQMV